MAELFNFYLKVEVDGVEQSILFLLGYLQMYYTTPMHLGSIFLSKSFFPVYISVYTPPTTLF